MEGLYIIVGEVYFPAFAVDRCRVFLSLLRNGEESLLDDIVYRRLGDEVKSFRRCALVCWSACRQGAA